VPVKPTDIRERRLATPRLLTVTEAAEWLGTSPRFVRRLIAERRIAYTRLGRHVRIAVADLDAFVAAGRVEPLVRLRRPVAGR
jgi:excisionase family DNA binding protein